MGVTGGLTMASQTCRAACGPQGVSCHRPDAVTPTPTLHPMIPVAAMKAASSGFAKSSDCAWPRPLSPARRCAMRRRVRVPENAIRQAGAGATPARVWVYSRFTVTVPFRINLPVASWPEAPVVAVSVTSVNSRSTLVADSAVIFTVPENEL